jgi:hypothetical protein
MGGSYNKDGRREDSKKGSKRKFPYHKTSGKTKQLMDRCGSEDALQLLGIRGWRRRAANRDEWRRLVRDAKVRKGL